MKRQIRMTKVRWAIVVIIWFIIVSCPFMLLSSKMKQIPAIRTDAVTKTDVVSYVSGPATVEPRVKVDISANIMGKVTKIYVKEGQPVKKGDLLLELEQTQYLAGRDEASATYRSAVSSYELTRTRWAAAGDAFARKKELYAKKLISAEQYDIARTQYEAEKTEFSVARDNVARARAGLVQAKDSLSKTVYTAPLDGVITDLNVEEGEFTVVGTLNAAGTVMLTVSDLAAMEVTTDIDETDVVSVKLGQPADITVDAFPDAVFRGEVIEVGSSAKESTALTASTEKTSAEFEVKVLLAPSRHALRPGMTATADIITATAKKVRAVPIQAIVTRTKAEVTAWKESGPGKKKGKPVGSSSGGTGKNDYVKGIFVLVDEKPLVKRARFVQVETGAVGDSFIEIKSGLKGDETIISGPYKILRKLNDGDVVQVERVPNGKGGPPEEKE